MEYSLQRSWLIMLGLLFMHGGAAIGLLFLPLQVWLSALLLGLCLTSLVLTIRAHALRLSSRAIIRIQPQGGRRWLLYQRSGRVRSLKLNKNSTCSVGIAILKFGSIFGPVVVVARDAMATPSFRRLRVYLLTHKNSA